MQQRPPGIVLSALALGLLASFFLLLTLLLSGTPLPASSDAAPAALLSAFRVGLTFVYIALAGWSIATLVGLLRMCSWARVSTMLIAGLLAGLGLLFALAMPVMQSIFAAGSAPLPPNVSPALLHRILNVMAAVSLVVTGLGVLWVVYLAQRRTREAFARTAAQAASPAAPRPGAQPYAVQPPYSSSPPPPSGARFPRTAAALRPVDPLTDFTVARPLHTANPPAIPLHNPQGAFDPPEPLPASYEAGGQPSASLPNQAWPTQPAGPLPAVRSRRPISVTVLAIFALVAAFFALFEVVSPLPIFLFGMIVSGWPVHVYGVVWAAALAIAGLGMLRLQRPAWLLSFALLGVGVLHFLVLLLPSARAHYIRYMQTLQQPSGGLSPQSLPPGMVALSIDMGMFFGLAIIALAGTLLWRAREAFPAEPGATPAPEKPG